MRDGFILSAPLAVGFCLAMAGPSAAQDRNDKVAGWTLSDTGGESGDRWVRIYKSAPNVALTYSPGLTNAVGTVEINFGDCNGRTSHIGLDNPPIERAAAIRKTVHEAFADFAKSCRVRSGAEDALMAGFGEAFTAVDTLITNKPYVLPPERSPNGQASADTKPQGQ